MTKKSRLEPNDIVQWQVNDTWFSGHTFKIEGKMSNVYIDTGKNHVLVESFGRLYAVPENKLQCLNYIKKHG